MSEHSDITETATKLDALVQVFRHFQSLDADVSIKTITEAAGIAPGDLPEIMAKGSDSANAFKQEALALMSPAQGDEGAAGREDVRCLEVRCIREHGYDAFRVGAERVFYQQIYQAGEHFSSTGTPALQAVRMAADYPQLMGAVVETLTLTLEPLKQVAETYEQYKGQLPETKREAFGQVAAVFGRAHDELTAEIIPAIEDFLSSGPTASHQP